jgi:hypothetical protein
MDRMKVIYDLQNDLWRIEQVQKASLSPEPVGLKATHGLVGSEEWWDNIERGRLPIHFGNIAQLWAGRSGDYPEVEITGLNGEGSRWLCPIDCDVAQRELKIGRAIEISYVAQQFKNDFSGKRTTDFLLTIKVDVPWATFS